MNNGKVIDTFLTHNESFKNIDDFTLLLICGLYYDIHYNLLDESSYKDIKNINFVKRIISINNQIKKIKDDDKNTNILSSKIENEIKSEIKSEIKNVDQVKTNTLKMKLNEDKSKNKSIHRISNDIDTSELSCIQDVSKSSVNLEKISYANIIKGIKETQIDDKIEISNGVDNSSEKVVDEKIKKEKSKIDYSNKEQFCKIVNDYKEHIIKVGEEAISKTGVDIYGNKNRYREISDEIKMFGNILHENFKDTFSNQYVAFSYIHYGPLKIKKDGSEQNYNDRNLSTYEKYGINLAFRDAQDYFINKGFKLLDITDPDYYTRDFVAKKSTYSNTKSTKIKIILVDNDYIIKHENVELWHNFNKINKIKEIVKEKKTKNIINKSNKSKILSAEEAFEEENNKNEEDLEIKEINKNSITNVDNNDMFSLIDE